jgi:hypothetical protein
MSDITLFQALSKIMEGNFTLINNIAKTQEPSKGTDKTTGAKKEQPLGTTVLGTKKKEVTQALPLKSTTKKKTTSKTKTLTKPSEPSKPLEKPKEESVKPSEIKKTPSEGKELGFPTDLTKLVKEGQNFVKEVQELLGIPPEKFIEQIEKRENEIKQELKKYDDEFETAVEVYYQKSIKDLSKLLEKAKELEKLLVPDEKKKMIRNLTFSLLAVSSLIHPTQSPFFLASVPTILKSWEEDDEREFQQKLRNWEIQMNLLQTIGQFNKEITNLMLERAKLKHELRTEDLRAELKTLMQMKQKLPEMLVVTPKEATQFLFDVYKLIEDLKHKAEELEIRKKQLEIKEKEFEFDKWFKQEKLRLDRARIAIAKEKDPWKQYKQFLDFTKKVTSLIEAIENLEDLPDEAKVSMLEDLTDYLPLSENEKGKVKEYIRRKYTGKKK